MRAQSVVQLDDQLTALNKSEPSLAFKHVKENSTTPCDCTVKPAEDDSDEFVSINVRRPSVDDSERNTSTPSTPAHAPASTSQALGALALLVDANGHCEGLDALDSSSAAHDVVHAPARLDSFTLAQAANAFDGLPDLLPATEQSQRKPNRKGLWVRFADEMGKDLRHERIIEEEEDLLSETVEEESEPGARQDSSGAFSSPLMLEFAQPVSDYAQFREKLDRLNVSLENVLAVGYRISGTVRVRNLTFEKKVFVRVTTDHWWSHTDYYATFVSSGPQVSSYSWLPPSNTTNQPGNAYDSFAFDLGDLSNKLTLHSAASAARPTEQQRIELAVCFECGTQTYWDNNYGKNYTILYVPPQERAAVVGTSDRRRRSPYTNTFRPDFSAFHDSFSEFTAWSHYDSYNPYY